MVTEATCLVFSAKVAANQVMGFGVKGVASFCLCVKQQNHDPAVTPLTPVYPQTHFSLHLPSIPVTTNV